MSAPHTSAPGATTQLPPLLADVVDEAVGRNHRDDPVVGRSGGPAGNARLTAWLGLALLVLIAIETFTALDVRGMLSWHVVVGTLMVPVALAKTGSTMWRIARYYTGHREYVTAGPPPMLLRLLGPLVILSTLGLLGSGLLLIALGPSSGRQGHAWLLGLDALTVHQGMFIVFGVTVGVHILARVYPAVTTATGRLMRADATHPRVRGGANRITIVLAALVAGAVLAGVVLGAAGDWRKDRGFDHFRDARGTFQRH